MSKKTARMYERFPLIRRIGYDDPNLRFDADGCSVQVCYGQQSPDIAQGVDKAYDDTLDQGAGLGQEAEGSQYCHAEPQFFRDIIEGVVREQRRIDPLVDRHLAEGWRLNRVDSILRAILRAGAYEMLMRKDVPSRVVITEYVDVANAFVDREETGMVDAVLDQLARRFRADEFERTE